MSKTKKSGAIISFFLFLLIFSTIFLSGTLIVELLNAEA